VTDHVLGAGCCCGCRYFVWSSIFNSTTTGVYRTNDADDGVCRNLGVHSVVHIINARLLPRNSTNSLAYARMWL
jgi:hypothetical protein